MNRVLSDRPQVEGDAHVHGTPVWLITTLRFILVAFGLGVMLFAIHDMALVRGQTRGWGGVVFCAPFLVALGLYPRIWRRQAKFIADERAVYFPCNELLVASRGGSPSSAWLEVPWQHISNLRQSTRTDPSDTAACVAFDVRVSSEEREKFFRNVSRPDDNKSRHGATLSVAYNDFPPSVSAIHRKLLALRKVRS